MATASTEPARGQVWLVRLGANEPGEPGKNRPAIIVSVDELRTGSERDLFVVVPISATAGQSDLRPQIAPAGTGVNRTSVAIPRAVRAVSRARLMRPIGSVPSETLEALQHALAVILGLE